MPKDKYEIVKSNSEIEQVNTNNTEIEILDDNPLSNEVKKPKKEKVKNIALIILISLIIAIILYFTYKQISKKTSEIIIDKQCLSTNLDQSFIYEEEILVSIPPYFLENNNNIKVLKYSKYPVGSIGLLEIAKAPKDTDIFNIYNIKIDNLEEYDNIVEIQISYDPAKLFEDNKTRYISAFYLDEDDDSFYSIPHRVNEKDHTVSIYINKNMTVALGIKDEITKLSYPFSINYDKELFYEALLESVNRPSDETVNFAFHSLLNAFNPKGLIDTFKNEAISLKYLNRYKDDLANVGLNMLFESISHRILSNEISKETISLLESSDNEAFKKLAMNAILSQYYLNVQLRPETLTSDEKVYEKAYRAYYDEEQKISKMDFYRTVKKIYDENSSANLFKTNLDDFLNEYVYMFWDDVKNVATYQAKIGNSEPLKPLTEETMKTISENFKKEILSDLHNILVEFIKKTNNTYTYLSYEGKRDLILKWDEPFNINIEISGSEDQTNNLKVDLVTVDNKIVASKLISNNKTSFSYSLLSYFINQKASTIIVNASEQDGSERKLIKSFTNIAPNKNISLSFTLSPFLHIEPNQKNVKPGDQIVFKAFRGKTKVEHVQYEVDKHQISQNGIFIAPNQEGMYEVIATSVNDYGFKEEAKAYIYVELK